MYALGTYFNKYERQPIHVLLANWHVLYFFATHNAEFPAEAQMSDVSKCMFDLWTYFEIQDDLLSLFGALAITDESTRERAVNAWAERTPVYSNLLALSTNVAVSQGQARAAGGARSAANDGGGELVASLARIVV
jgi:hypothetical protein